MDKINTLYHNDHDSIDWEITPNVTITLDNNTIASINSLIEKHNQVSSTYQLIQTGEPLSNFESTQFFKDNPHIMHALRRSPIVTSDTFFQLTKAKLSHIWRIGERSVAAINTKVLLDRPSTYFVVKLTEPIDSQNYFTVPRFIQNSNKPMTVGTEILCLHPLDVSDECIDRFIKESCWVIAVPHKNHPEKAVSRVKEQRAHLVEVKGYITTIIKANDDKEATALYEKYLSDKLNRKEL